jgi:hypothetical protein
MCVRATVVACVLLGACTSAVGAPGSSPTLPPDWSIREAAGLRIAAPTAWQGPEVLPARDATNGPRHWIVFRNPSGAEALTIMTWRDATASSLAASQYESELPQGEAPRQLTFVDGSSTRTAIALTAFARWNDAIAAGTYECRHLFVQVDATLVADVITCGAHVRGSSTPTPDQRRIQERVVVRLASAAGQP